MTSQHREQLEAERAKAEVVLTRSATAQDFTRRLLAFGKSHELVVMARDVGAQLERFQTPLNTDPPSWRQPRLQPPEDLGDEEIAEVFGKLTFEGEIVRCVFVKSAAAQAGRDPETDVLGCHRRRIHR